MGARLHGGGLAAWWGTGCVVGAWLCGGGLAAGRLLLRLGAQRSPRVGPTPAGPLNSCSVTQTQQRFSRSCFLL